ncbi:CD63 antigen-like [Lampris incognitus]|uniref:CD63 antigen-like n=1 Tax=Lampris incognitus TaxID=2546036 RepID=UPI0024B6054D|nr:CD63 antigen-like [Lampris incognitus]
MGKCCSMKCIFIFFTSLFVASGVGLIVIGVMSLTTSSELAIFSGSSLSQVAILLIVVGVFMAVISFVGCFGAFIDSSSMLTAFICVLIVIIGLEIIAGIALYVFRSKTAVLQMNSAINSRARAVITAYSPGNRRTIDNIQGKFKCCGADSYTDWYTSVGWGKTDAVPDSCCVVKTEGCGEDITNIHKKGCIWAVKRFLLKNLVWIAAVCIALGVVEVLGVLLGACMCTDIKRRNYQNIK